MRPFVVQVNEGAMNEEKLAEILIEGLRITRGLRVAINLISVQQAEIIALRGMLQAKGVLNAQELDAARDEALSRLGPAIPVELSLDQLEPADGEWKM